MTRPLTEAEKKVQKVRRADEISWHLEGYFHGPEDSIWDIMELPMHGQSHSTVVLPVVHEDEAVVGFLSGDTSDELQRSLERARTTMLTGFLDVVAEERRRPLSERARGLDDKGLLLPAATDLTYAQLPKYYRWNVDRWVRRRAPHSVDIVTRVAFMQPQFGDVYYLRLLLVHPIHGVGPSSFHELRTVRDRTYVTFQEVCEAHGLLATDATLLDTLHEAARFQSARQLRVLFAELLLHHEVRDPVKLYEAVRTELCDDFTHARRRAVRDFTLAFASEDEANAVAVIDRILLEGGTRNLAEFLDGATTVPLPTVAALRGDHSRLTLEEEERLNNTLDALLSPGTVERTTAELDRQLAEEYARLQPSQQVVAHAIVEDVRSAEAERRAGSVTLRSRSHWLAGRAGCGKTTLNMYIIRKLRRQGYIVLALASSGIASLLLPGGRTVHSRLKVPLQLKGGDVCNIVKGSALARMVDAAALILWDEATMQSNQVVRRTRKHRAPTPSARARCVRRSVRR